MTLTASPEAICQACGKQFQRFSTFQRVCRTIRCASRIVKLDKRREAQETRARKEDLKSLSELRAEAQTVFNRFIRARDRKAGYGCICCGAPLDWNSTKPGGSIDAGHYVSRGSAIELAFDERNVNAQRKSCNRPGGTTRDKFRSGMVARWGAEVVAQLEGPQTLPRLRHDDFRAIKRLYRTKLKELEVECELS